MVHIICVVHDTVSTDLGLNRVIPKPEISIKSNYFTAINFHLENHVHIKHDPHKYSLHMKHFSKLKFHITEVHCKAVLHQFQCPIATTFYK